VEELKAALEVKNRRLSEAPNGPLVFLDIRQVCDRVGHKKSWVWQHSRDGTFPPPIRVGIKSARWVSASIDAWMLEQIERARRGTT